jgi:hypothetical protein
VPSCYEEAIKLTYSPGLYLAWKKGRLHDKWFMQHRNIFDEDDLRIAQNQHEYGIHFGEWFTAIDYAKKRYGVLVEKYIYGSDNGIHSRKRGFISEFLGKDGVKLLRKWKEKYHAQPPDLFVFKNKEYFFVEVKRGRDVVRDCQSAYFETIEKELGCKVVIVDLQEERIKGILTS